MGVKPKKKRAGWTGPAVIVLLVIAGFALTLQFVDPPPPTHFRLGTGLPGGSYHAWGEDLRRVLAEEGYDVELVPSEGSLQNLERLRAGELDVAFVQGGTTRPSDAEKLKALGALAYEPLWVVQARGAEPLRLTELSGLPVYLGNKGSGGRALAETLLELNAVGVTDATQIGDWGDGLLSGALAAAFLVSAPDAPRLHDRLEQGVEGLQIADLVQAEALARHLPFLAALEIPAGLIDPDAHIPATPRHTVAATAALIAREEFHEALPLLMLDACDALFGGPGLLAPRGHFPAAEPLDLPLGETAEHFHEYGLSFLHRLLPFRIAATLDRLKILLLPLLTLLIPLMRFAPPLLRWRHRSRIYTWYRDLRRIEGEARAATTPEEVEHAAEELARIEKDISQVEVPLSYHEELYNLRLHLGVVQRDVIEAARAAGKDTST